MKKIDLTKGKVIAVIAALALPIMGSSLLQFTYNLIDMIWVGKLGSHAVASIGSSSLYVNIGNALNSLVVIGTGIKVAHAVGKKNEKEIKEYINYYDTNKCNPINFINEIINKYLNGNKEDKNLVIERIQDVRRITKYEKEQTNNKVKKRILPLK